MYAMTTALLLRRLPKVDYQTCWQAMRDFTDQRDATTPDEIWLVEHPPVFTLGQAGKPEHVLAAGDIPVVQCDRGGQVTYHAPGQTVAYLMIDIKRLDFGARALVSAIENALVLLLQGLGIDAHSDPDAPGVYVADRKIASLGLRIRRGNSYHGLALNRDMDLTPWQRINPCGYIGLAMTSIAAEGINIDRSTLEDQLITQLSQQLGETIKEAASPDWYHHAAATTRLPIHSIPPISEGKAL